MKKLLISALALVLCGNVMAQDPKEIKAQQKAIDGLLKEAEKSGKVTEDAMGQVDLSKKPDFEAAMKLIEQAKANPAAATKAGDIARVAGNIMNNKMRFATPGAQQGDNDALKDYLSACGDGFMYIMEAWNAYKTPDEKGKVNTKFNDQMAATAANLFLNSSGLYNCALIAYQNEDWMNSAKYFDLSADAIGCELLEYAKSKNPIMAANLAQFENDSVKYKNKLFAASTYAQVDPSLAVKAYNALKNTAADQASVFGGLYGIYAQKADTAQMIDILKEAMTVLPEDNSFSNQLFYIYLDKQDYEGAISSLKASLNNNPENISVIILIARLYTQTGKFNEAAPYYQKALSIDANSLEANLYCGVNYIAEMEAGESEMLKNRTADAVIDKFSNEKMDAALPYLRKAYAADTNHENTDIVNVIMNVLYRKFSPSGAPNRDALIKEYNEIADAYGRPQYNR
ncbi:MAG: tetratricopeptide repeat protein [Bacteroidales bacterium]|nr:tetratricopeptide repeat protein [Bacteroidales bacterium]